MSESGLIFHAPLNDNYNDIGPLRLAPTVVDKQYTYFVNSSPKQLCGGRAMTNNNVNSYVTYPHHAAFSLANFTFCFWLKPLAKICSGGATETTVQR